VRVRGSASTITEAHIAELLAGGLTEDEVFDATVCAAFRAGLERYEAGMNALEEAKRAP
jgi:alkylhydroperoxidase/carboxymuconolactone decarboxylase family protein YurZ